MKRNAASGALSALYALGSPFACLSLAVLSATAYVEHKQISHFEGGAGYEVMYQIPLWFVLYVAVVIGAYLLLRRRLWLLAVAAVCLGVASMPAVSYIAELAWDVRLPPGPLGRL